MWSRRSIGIGIEDLMDDNTRSISFLPFFSFFLLLLYAVSHSLSMFVDPYPPTQHDHAIECVFSLSAYVYSRPSKSLKCCWPRTTFASPSRSVWSRTLAWPVKRLTTASSTSWTLNPKPKESSSLAPIRKCRESCEPFDATIWRQISIGLDPMDGPDVYSSPKATNRKSRELWLFCLKLILYEDSTIIFFHSRRKITNGIPGSSVSLEFFYIFSFLLLLNGEYILPNEGNGRSYVLYL